VRTHTYGDDGEQEVVITPATDEILKGKSELVSDDTDRSCDTDHDHDDGDKD